MDCGLGRIGAFGVGVTSLSLLWLVGSSALAVCLLLCVHWSFSIVSCLRSGRDRVAVAGSWTRRGRTNDPPTASRWPPDAPRRPLLFVSRSFTHHFDAVIISMSV